MAVLPTSIHLNRLLKQSAFDKRPTTAVELREFCRWVLSWEERRDVILAADEVGEDIREDGLVRTADVEAVWSLLGTVAGSDPYPAFQPGPYAGHQFRAALTRVMEWCDVRNRHVSDVVAVVRQKGKGKDINARMLATIQDEPASVGWSAQQWAKCLGCTKSTVAGTVTWKRTLMAAKAMLKTDAVERRKRTQVTTDD